MKKIIAVFLLFAGVFLFSSVHEEGARAFSAGGCDGDCKKCHALNSNEVGGVLKKMNMPNAKVLGIRISPVKGLWEISLDDKGKRGVFYMDFSKKYMMPGPILEVGTGENKTQESLERLQTKKKVDVSKIPLDRNLAVGDKKAPTRVIVFTDPDCPFCGKLHQEIKKVVHERKDIVFFIKLFPLKMHKDSYWKAKSIACSKSVRMLEDNFEGRTIPKTECPSKEIDNNLKLAESLGLTGTPALILPGGRVYAGYLPADKLIELINGRE